MSSSLFKISTTFAWDIFWAEIHSCRFKCPCLLYFVLIFETIHNWENFLNYLKEKKYLHDFRLIESRISWIQYSTVTWDRNYFNSFSWKKLSKDQSNMVFMHSKMQLLGEPRFFVSIPIQYSKSKSIMQKIQFLCSNILETIYGLQMSLLPLLITISINLHIPKTTCYSHWNIYYNHWNIRMRGYIVWFMWQ